MKRFLLVTFLLFESYFFYAQTTDPNWKNLIPNYSFEVVENDFPLCEGGNYYSTTPYDCLKEYWDGVYEWTHPLKRNFLCGFSGPDVGTANVLPTQSRSGVFRGNAVSGEYLVVPLWHEGLKKGKKYFIEFFTLAGGGEKVYFSNGQSRQCGNNEIIKPSGGIIVEAFSPNMGSPDWNRTKLYYTPFFDLDWMTLGIDGDPGEGTGGSSWDDLRIYEVQENGCRDNWYFDNTVFNYPFEFFQASDKIYVGNGVDPENGVNHIPGDVIQYSGTDIVLQAGNQVVIDNTFIMEPGSSKLIIENKPCKDDLCPDELSFEDEILCEIPSLQIGTSPNPWGTSVKWSPSTHLDNPNVANPTFTSPGGTGTIQYNVQVTYTCDGGFQYTSSYPVTVQYTDSDDPDASISMIETEWDVYNFSAEFEVGEGVSEITITIASHAFYEETFYVGDDFNCCNFNWELPEAWKWSSCHDDNIKVIAKNACSEVEKELSLNWSKSQIPFEFPILPNVITPNNDGVNDELCFNIQSADSYEIVVLNQWQNEQFSSSGGITSSSLCTWAPAPNSVTDGTYFYLLTITDLCGNIQQEDQFIDVFNGKSGLIHNDNDNEENQIAEYITNIEDSSQDMILKSIRSDENIINNILVFPNPSDGLFNITSQETDFSSISIFDFKGSLIYSNKCNSKQITVDISDRASGIYWIEVETTDGIKRQKMSIK